MVRRTFNLQTKTVQGNEGSKCKYPTRLDTYGCGCLHDCNYCYAKSLLEFRGLWNANNPSVIDTKDILKQVRKIPSNSVVRLGGMTDCFQSLELHERVTYKTIKMLNKKRIHYLIVTKSDIVARDEYIKIMDKELAHIQITVTTLDDNLYKELKYEKAPLPSKRIEAIKKLQDNGFDVAIRVSPFIDEFIDIDKLNNLGINKCVLEFLRVNHWIKKWFNIDYTPYVLKENGYSHRTLRDKLNIIRKLKFKELSICEDVEEHYKYYKEHGINKDDCCNLRGVD